jgi:hypothetical protein
MAPVIPAWSNRYGFFGFDSFVGAPLLAGAGGLSLGGGGGTLVLPLDGLEWFDWEAGAGAPGG